MSHSVVVAAPNQTTGYELRAQVDELDDFTVVQVADNSKMLLDLVVEHSPEIVVVHEQLGPSPVLQTVREALARRPGTAVVLQTEQLSPDVMSAAMDAGVRAILQAPTSHEDLEARLTASAEWVTQMRRHLTAEADAPGASRGRMVAVAGSKGGVGTTTLAVHLAHHAVTTVAGRSVCLVDLDLDHGDVRDFLGITHRLDISDLAKVADDLSSQVIGSSVHRAESGLGTLLSPSRIEDVGEVGERETVLILGALRRQYDLVVVDCGSTVSPASAAAVESADEVVLVTNPDLLALRGAHATAERWGRVGARDVENVHVVINRVSKDSDIQPDTAGRLLPTKPLDVTLPEAFAVLQRGLNHQDPERIQNEAWWNRISDLAQAVGTAGSTSAPAAASKGIGLFRRKGAKAAPAQEDGEERDEAGQATVEFVGVIPIVILLMLILWQLGLWGMSAAYTSHAADEAARIAGIGATDRQVQEKGLEAVPSWFRDNMTVRQDSMRGEVRVTGKLPVFIPAFTIDGLHLTSKTPIVREGS